MLDDAAEPVRPPASDPVHHIAAVGSAERAGAIRVELRVVRGRESETFLQVLERPAAPILVDRIGEPLAVACRPMEIDADGSIAGSGEQARVPAVRPTVGEAALRPAVDEKGDR